MNPRAFTKAPVLRYHCYFSTDFHMKITVLVPLCSLLVLTCKVTLRKQLKKKYITLQSYVSFGILVTMVIVQNRVDFTGTVYLISLMSCYCLLLIE